MFLRQTLTSCLTRLVRSCQTVGHYNLNQGIKVHDYGVLPKRFFLVLFGSLVITYSRVWINQVWLPILLVVSWTGKMNISLPPFASENLVSRDGFGRPVPRKRAHSPYSGLIWCLHSPRFPRRRPFIHLYRHMPSGQSRVYRVTQLRTDGVTTESPPTQCQ